MAYKRSILLINPKFQLKISALVCFLAIASSLIYPWTISDLLSSFSSFIQANHPEAAKTILKKEENLMSVLLLWQIGSNGFIFLYFIYVTHKIAGPMHKLQLYLENIKNGNPITKLYFRNGDSFQEVADSINDAFETLEEQRKQDFMYLSEVNSYLKNLEVVLPEDKKVVLQEITNKLNDIQKRFD
ncbi:MAG: hypothetical protein CME70_07720 [Halobacteriovorax sp.]|nr:hypothetical protein [Halobacteriovorax sp.]